MTPQARKIISKLMNNGEPYLMFNNHAPPRPPASGNWSSAVSWQFICAKFCVLEVDVEKEQLELLQCLPSFVLPTK